MVSLISFDSKLVRSWCHHRLNNYVCTHEIQVNSRPERANKKYNTYHYFTTIVIMCRGESSLRVVPSVPPVDVN